MTDDEIIVIVQGCIDGKKIECKNKSIKASHWQLANAPTWNFNNLDYRIKKEPRTFYCNEYNDGSKSTIKLDIETLEYSEESGTVKILKLLEVLDDND